MAPGALLNKLSAKGFLTKGHYKLVSGLHSNTYINVRLALMDPDIRRDFTQGVLALCPDFTPDCVAAFTIGGVHLGESVAEELGVPFIVGRTGDSAIEWKDVEYMNGCKSLLLVDDILTTAEQLDGGLSELEKTAVQTLQVIVAVDRSGGSATLRFRGNEMKPLSVETVNGLKTYSPTDCPDCNLGIPYTDLSDPENDFSAILLYGDPSLWERAVAGFEKVYGLQGNEQKRNDIVTAYGRLSASVRDALPTSRIREDNGLINFIGRVENLARRCGVRRAVAAEVVGQLMSLSAIRVENRGIGCSLLVGDHEKVLSYLG